MSVHLVVIEKDNIYTFYSGKTKVVKVQSREPIPEAWLELFRKDHVLLMKSMIGTPSDPSLA